MAKMRMKNVATGVDASISFSRPLASPLDSETCGVSLIEPTKMAEVGTDITSDQ